MAEKLEFGDISLEKIYGGRVAERTDRPTLAVVPKCHPYLRKKMAFALVIEEGLFPGDENYVPEEDWAGEDRDEGTGSLKHALLFENWEDGCKWVIKHGIWYRLSEKDQEEYEEAVRRKKLPKSGFQVEIDGRKRRVRQLSLKF